MTIEEAFGEVIRELRKANQFSQEKLAEVSNLDRSFIGIELDAKYFEVAENRIEHE